MPPPKSLPSLNSMTFKHIPPQPYAAEASKVRDFLADEALEKSARMMPVPALIRDPAMAVVDHYHKARERTVAREEREKLVAKLEKDMAERRRKREVEAKRRMQERKEALEAGTPEEDLDRLDQALIPEVDDEEDEVTLAAAMDDGQDNEPMSDDEVVDQLFEQSFRDEASLVRALDRAPELLRLFLPEHTWLSAQLLRQLPQRYGATLLGLNLRGTHADDVCVQEVLLYCRSLQSLDLGRLSNQIYSLVGLEGLTQLRELSLARSGPVVTAEVVGSMRALRKLHSLDLSFCENVDDLGLADLAEGVRGLHTLNLSCCPKISSTGLFAVAKANPNLQNLWLMLNEQHIMSDDGIATTARYLKRIRTLDLSACPQIGRQAVSAISRHCQYVSKLGLASIEHLGVQELQGLLAKTAGSLVELDITGCQDATFDMLADGLSKAKSLKRLTVSLVVNITDENFAELQRRFPEKEFIRHSRSWAAADDLSEVLRMPPMPMKLLMKKRKGAGKAKKKK